MIDDVRPDNCDHGAPVGRQRRRIENHDAYIYTYSIA